MPEVSVIIPNYNHAAYLNQRIDSVLNQTYQDFELIIIDDCSTDNSVDVINQYKDHPKISQIFFNETNSGNTFLQWEKGITAARGKYVWLAESDDWCEDSLLQTLINGFAAHSNCVLGYVQSYVIMGDNQIDRVSTHNALSTYVEGRAYVNQYLGVNTIMNASMVLFKRDCFFAVSPVYKTFKLCGDWVFWVEVALQGDVFISGRVLNYFRKHNADVSGKMNTTGNNFIEEIRVLTILKNNQLISYQQFKTYLLTLYIRYKVYKHKLNAGLSETIEATFFNHDGKSLKSFLNQQSFLALAKGKIMRRLKLS